MKTVLKILVIFVLAVLVGSLFYGAVTAISSSSGTDQSSMPERPADREFDRPDREEGASGLPFPADAVKNLAIISIISVIFLNISRWLGRKKPTANIVQ